MVYTIQLHTIECVFGRFGPDAVSKHSWQSLLLIRNNPSMRLIQCWIANSCILVSADANLIRR